MKLFRWLTKNRDYYIDIVRDKRGEKGRYWWRIMKEPEIKIVCECPTPGFARFDDAEAAAREFLDGIDSDYLEIDSHDEDPITVSGNSS